MVALVSMVIVGMWLPVEGVILPVYFSGLDQPERLGITIMAMSVGGVIGALVYSARGHGWRSRPVFVAAFTLSGSAVLGMAVFPPFGLFVLFGFAAGLCYGPVGPIINLVMQNRTPFRLRGRVVSLLTSSAYIAGPIGYVLVGPGVELFGVEPVFIAIALGVLAVGVTTIFLPSLRGMDAPAQE
jgi:MFS family permease